MKNIPREKKIAQRIAQRNSLTPPVNVVETLKKYADYLEADLPSEADAVCIMTKRPLVVIQKTQAPNRKRFTIAHEIGHIVIPWHHGMISCHTDIEDDIEGSAYQKMEAEANSFAAELLMPSTWLKEIIYQNEEQGIEKIIEIVTETAEVSRIAAFYSVFPLLPVGYFFYIVQRRRGFINSKNLLGLKFLSLINHILRRCSG